MPRFRYLLSFALACVLCATAGCDQQPAPSAATLPETSTRLDVSAPNEDSGQGAGYAFHIRYPQLPADWDVLAHALRNYADVRKKELLDARAAADIGDGPDYSLDLEFNVARRTAEFVSVLATGASFSGGAHPAPIVASFNLNTSNGKLIALSDLFGDVDAALKALSAETRRQLEGRYEAKLHDAPSAMTAKQLASNLADMRQWVDRGTEPKAENFAVFLVDGLESRAIGLELIFPPYQVASYADGAQQVEVPANVFYALLKPEYRDAFQIDTEADRPAAGVR